MKGGLECTQLSSSSLRDDMGPVAADPMGELLVWGPGAFFTRLSEAFSVDSSIPPTKSSRWDVVGLLHAMQVGQLTGAGPLVQRVRFLVTFGKRPTVVAAVLVGDSAPIHRWPSFSASTVVGGRGSTVTVGC